MKFWQWSSVALVIVVLGLSTQAAPGMAATTNRTASAFINGGDTWLTGDPDGGSTKDGPSQGYSGGYSARATFRSDKHTNTILVRRLDWMRVFLSTFHF
jgi:hypothetical protein